MSVENNKAIVETYFELMNEADPAKMAAYLCDDFAFESMLQKPEAFNFTWGKDEFTAASGNMSAAMKAPLKIWIVSMMGEDDKVAVEAESYGEMLNDKIYNNVYHFLFKLRDGKIYNVR